MLLSAGLHEQAAEGQALSDGMVTLCSQPQHGRMGDYTLSFPQGWNEETASLLLSVRSAPCQPKQSFLFRLIIEHQCIDLTACFQLAMQGSCHGGWQSAGHLG